MIGIDLSRHSIKIVQLSNTKPQKMLTYCWHDIPDGLIEQGVFTDEVAMRRVILEALKACSIAPTRNDTVIASVPETQSFLRVLNIPLMDDSEISEAVQWEVAQHIPFGLESVYLDWQSVEGETVPEGRQEVLVGVAEKRVVNPLYKLLFSIGLEVGALELETQAVVRSLVSDELRDKKGLLIVDLGSAATNVVIHDRGTIRFTSSLQKGARQMLEALSNDERKAVTGPPGQEIVVDDKLVAKELQPKFDALVVEIHGVVEFYRSLDPSHKLNEVLLTGGGSNLPGLGESFLRHFGEVHIQRGNPWINVLEGGHRVNAPMGIQEAVHYSTAIGLALRRVLR